MGNRSFTKSLQPNENGAPNGHPNQDEAYRFARGEKIHSEGQYAQLLVPLDFMMVADRYENLALNVGAARGLWKLSLSVANATDHDDQYLPRTTSGDLQFYGLIQAHTTYMLQVTYYTMR